jgi:hypothetical protein
LRSKYYLPRNNLDGIIKLLFARTRASQNVRQTWLERWNGGLGMRPDVKSCDVIPAPAEPDKLQKGVRRRIRQGPRCEAGFVLARARPRLGGGRQPTSVARAKLLSPAQQQHGGPAVLKPAVRRPATGRESPGGHPPICPLALRAASCPGCPRQVGIESGVPCAFGSLKI